MTPIPPYQPGQAVSDYVLSLIRTVVPVLWGALITYLVSLIPGVAQLIDPANVIGFGPAVAAVLASAWYALMRKIEPMLPAWLTVIVLGSNTPPVYPLTGRVASAVPPGPVSDGRAD
jgi:hypothetical protein